MFEALFIDKIDDIGLTCSIQHRFVASPVEKRNMYGCRQWSSGAGQFIRYESAMPTATTS
jgi:hypothetical protein